MIFMVRDPRAVVSSILDVGRRARKAGKPVPYFARSLHQAVSFVKDCFEKGFAAMGKNPRRFFLMKYEALVKDTEAETKRLCDFLGLEWSSEMLSPALKAHPGEQGMTCDSNAIWYDKEMFNRNPDTEKIDKLKSKLNLSQQLRIPQAFKPMLEKGELDYDVRLTRCGKPQMLKAVLTAGIRRKAGMPAVFLKQFKKTFDKKYY